MQIKNANELHTVAPGTRISFTDDEGDNYEGILNSVHFDRDASHFTIRLTDSDGRRRSTLVHASTSVMISA